MMFPEDGISFNYKLLDNKTILTMDLKFLEELWVPGNLVSTHHVNRSRGETLHKDSIND